MYSEHSISRIKEYAFLAILFTAAFTTRLYGVGTWPVDGDEIFTFSRALNQSYSYTFPGTYFLVALSDDPPGVGFTESPIVLFPAQTVQQDIIVLVIVPM